MIRTDDDSHGCILKGNMAFGTQSALGIRIKGKNKTYNNFLMSAYLTTGKAGNTCSEASEFKHNVVYPHGRH